MIPTNPGQFFLEGGRRRSRGGLLQAYLKHRRTQRVVADARASRPSSGTGSWIPALDVGETLVRRYDVGSPDDDDRGLLCVTNRRLVLFGELGRSWFLPLTDVTQVESVAQLHPGLSLAMLAAWPVLVTGVFVALLTFLPVVLVLGLIAHAAGVVLAVFIEIGILAVLLVRMTRSFGANQTELTVTGAQPVQTREGSVTTGSAVSRKQGDLRDLEGRLDRRFRPGAGHVLTVATTGRDALRVVQELGAVVVAVRAGVTLGELNAGCPEMTLPNGGSEAGVPIALAPHETVVRWVLLGRTRFSDITSDLRLTSHRLIARDVLGSAGGQRWKEWAVHTREVPLDCVAWWKRSLSGATAGRNRALDVVLRGQQSQLASDRAFDPFVIARRRVSEPGSAMRARKLPALARNIAIHQAFRPGRDFRVEVPVTAGQYVGLLLDALGRDLVELRAGIVPDGEAPDASDDSRDATLALVDDESVVLRLELGVGGADVPAVRTDIQLTTHRLVASCRSGSGRGDWQFPLDEIDTVTSQQIGRVGRAGGFCLVVLPKSRPTSDRGRLAAALDPWRSRQPVFPGSAEEVEAARHLLSRALISLRAGFTPEDGLANRPAEPALEGPPDLANSGSGVPAIPVLAPPAPGDVASRAIGVVGMPQATGEAGPSGMAVAFPAAGESTRRPDRPIVAADTLDVGAGEVTVELFDVCMADHGHSPGRLEVTNHRLLVFELIPGSERGALRFEAPIRELRQMVWRHLRKHDEIALVTSGTTVDQFTASAVAWWRRGQRRDRAVDHRCPVIGIHDRDVRRRLGTLMLDVARFGALPPDEEEREASAEAADLSAVGEELVRDVAIGRRARARLTNLRLVLDHRPVWPFARPRSWELPLEEIALLIVQTSWGGPVVGISVPGLRSTRTTVVTRSAHFVAGRSMLPWLIAAALVAIPSFRVPEVLIISAWLVAIGWWRSTRGRTKRAGRLRKTGLDARLGTFRTATPGAQQFFGELGALLVELRTTGAPAAADAPRTTVDPALTRCPVMLAQGEALIRSFDVPSSLSSRDLGRVHVTSQRFVIVETLRALGWRTQRWWDVPLENVGGVSGKAVRTEGHRGPARLSAALALRVAGWPALPLFWLAPFAIYRALLKRVRLGIAGPRDVSAVAVAPLLPALPEGRPSATRKTLLKVASAVTVNGRRLHTMDKPVADPFARSRTYLLPPASGPMLPIVPCRTESTASLTGELNDLLLRLREGEIGGEE
jgi:hypothetical protein